MKKRILILILSILALSIFFTACNNNGNGDIANIQSVSIVEGSIPTTCTVGETLDLSQLKILVTYKDGSTEEIGYAELEISPIDTSAAGEKKVTVTYKGFSVEFTVNVTEEEAEATLTAIKIVSGTISSSYYLGQVPDYSGIQVEATYSDGSTKLVPANELEITGIDTSVAGEKNFTATYKGLTDTIKIVVYDINSIKVISGTVAGKIFVGEVLDTSNIQILVEYSDETQEIVEAKDLVVTDIDTSSYGKKNLVITWKGIEVNYEIEVVGAISLTVNPGSVATSVKVNGTLDTGAITGYITYSDETKKALTTEELNVEAFDTSVAGAQTLVVKYGELSTTVDVTVVGVSSLTVVSGIKSEMLKGETFDNSEIKVEVTYTDETTEYLGLSDLALGTIDTSVGGEQKLTVSYLDKTIEYTVKVCEITSIRVSGINSLLDEGYTPVIANMEVWGVYNDEHGTEIKLDASFVSTNIDEIDWSAKGAKSLTVKYDGEYGKFETVFNFVINPAPAVVDIEITAYDGFVAIGEAYNVNSVVVYAIYDNGDRIKVNATVGTVATDKAGDAALNVSYTDGDVTKTKSVTVKVLPVTALEISGVEGSVYYGGAIDMSDLSVKVTFSDGENTITRALGQNDVTVSKLDTTKVGEGEVIVSYKGFEAAVKVNVVGVESMSIVEGTVADKVFPGALLDVTNIKVNVKYTDETVDTLNYDEIVVVLESTEGRYTVTYLNSTIESTFGVYEIDELIVSGIDSVYAAGVIPDLSGMKVVGLYNDAANTPVEIPADQFTTNFNEVNWEDEGDRIFIVSYGKVQAVLVISSTAPVLEGIEINEKYPSVVAVGDTYDKSAILVYAVYGNNTKKLITPDSITDIVTDNAGNVTFTVSYTEGDVTVYAEATVKVLPVISLEVSGVASNIYYNSVLDLSKITVKVTFSDGEDSITRTLGQNDVTVSQVDTTKVGKHEMTISYRGFEVEEHVTVIGVESITVIDGTLMTEKLPWETFSTESLRVSIKFTNGPTATLGKEKLTLGDFDPETGKISITYLDKTIEYTVKICVIDRLEVTRVKTSLYTGDSISLTGVKVVGFYNDKNTTHVDITEYVTNVNDINTSVPGTKALVFTYGVASETVNVVVADPALESITVAGGYDKYVGLGQKYNTDSIKVTATYVNGTTKQNVAADIKIDTDKAGKFTFTISYTENGITKETTVEVSVLPITKLEISGIANVVEKGGDLDISNVKAHVTFSDGVYTTYVEVGTSDGVIVPAPDTTTNGGFEKTLTVTYLGFSADHKYKVKAPTKITIFSGLTDTLRQGYAVDLSELYLEITYTTGEVEQKKAIDLEGVKFSGTEVNATKFTISYEGCADIVRELKLITPVSISALNNTVPATVPQGASVLYENIKLTVVYNNGEVYLVGIEDKNLSLTPEVFDTQKTGTTAIVFKYFGFETSANILVKGVSKVEVISGIISQINVGQKLDTSNILVRVLYTDGTYFYADRNSAHLEVGTIDTSTTGEKELVVKYQGIPCDPTVKITVIEVKVEGLIFGALLPDELVARQSYKNNFKNPNNPYVVGDDNPFYFYLNVISLNDKDEIVEVDGKTIPTSANVYEVNKDGSNTLLEGAALDAVVRFNSSANSYDFTEAAIGRTFTLEIWPKDESSYTNLDAVKKSYTVTIVDGYNIYDAKELNILTNYDNDINGKDIAGEVIQCEVVDAFLAKHKIEKPANLKGIVLHGNLELSQEDLPPEYFYEYTKDGVTKVGMYDHLKVFDHRFTTENPTMTIYGNYYSIYSYNLPPVIEKGYANNEDEFSSSVLFSFKANPEKEYYRYPNGTFDSGRYQANIQDIAMRDNDPNSNDQSASERHMRGLTAMRIGVCVGNFNNVNIDAYMTSLSTEDDMTTVNLTQVKFYNAWQTHLFLWSNNQYQDYVGDEKNDLPFDNVYGQRVNITDSLVAKCGGPVILAQSKNRDYPVNNNSGHDVVIDDKSIIYSYVTGQEAWFVAVGQTSLAANIMAMNQLIAANNKSGNPASYLSDKYITNVQTVNMIMVNMGTGTTLNPAEQYSGSFIRVNADGSKTVGLNMAASYDASRDKNTALDNYKNQTGGAAPIFQSSEGGIAFSDGKTGCYSVPATNPGLPESKFYQGDYIALYYNGAGILLEYYHD